MLLPVNKFKKSNHNKIKTGCQLGAVVDCRCLIKATINNKMYLSYVMAVSLIGKGNRGALRK